MQTQCYSHGSSPMPAVRMVYSMSLSYRENRISDQEKKILGNNFLGDVKLAGVMIIYFIGQSRHFS